MIPYTLTKQGTEEARQVRTSWAEVPLSQYVDIMTEPTPLESACKLCGLSLEEYGHSSGILDSWIGHALEMVAKGAEGPRPAWLPADLGKAGIGRFELCKKYLRLAPHQEHAYPYLYAIYCYADQYDALDSLIGDFPTELFWKAAKLPVLETIGACAHIVAEVLRLTEKYAPVLDAALTAEQMAAGIERFEKYGFYPTLLSYSGGDLTRLREVLEVPAAVFFHALCVDTEKAEYERQYNEIVTRNRNRK
ncbi:hypothetical protein GCM10023188_25920 [Pontibacter saemangeumensis]|uniref:Uncharacterized protein n=1 Tax=Pontibacter saemangeumensis TaxID=1084525 RepID=A0ABP8LR93_9BACT